MRFFPKLWRRPLLVLSLAAVLVGSTGVRETAAQQPGREMISWVVLFDSDVEFTEESLRVELDRVWPGEFLPERSEGSFVVGGAPPDIQFMIKSGVPGASGVFLLHNWPIPYSEFSDVIDRIPDESLRDIAQAQMCWMSIDLMGKSDEAEAYKFIGKVLARLAPPDAAVLLHPARGTAERFTEDVRRKLADGGH